MLSHYWSNVFSKHIYVNIISIHIATLKITEDIEVYSHNNVVIGTHFFFYEIFIFFFFV